MEDVMALSTKQDERDHIGRGEEDIKDWKELERAALDELENKKTQLSRNPTDPTLKKQCDQIGDKYKNIKQARESREQSVEAAKRTFGWPD